MHNQREHLKLRLVSLYIWQCLYDTLHRNTHAAVMSNVGVRYHNDKDFDDKFLRILLDVSVLISPYFKNVKNAILQP